MTQSWRPILSNELLASAESAISTLAWSVPDDCIDEGVVTDGLIASGQSLASGPLGWAVFLAHLSQANDDALCRDRAVRVMNHAVSLLEARTTAPASPRRVKIGLWDGLAGVGWALEHCTRILGVAGNAEGLSDPIAMVLGRCLSAAGPPMFFNLMHGTVGIGVFDLERIEGGACPRLLFLVQQCLERTAVPMPVGKCWLTPGTHLKTIPQDRKRHRFIDFGMGRGNAGVVALLSLLHKTPWVLQSTEALLRESVAFLRSQYSAGEEVGALPALIDADLGERTPSFLSWCYGELGISVALLSAATALNDPDLAAEAESLALRAANRPFSAALPESGLVRGTAGVAHLFNCWYQVTGRSEFLSAAVRWFERLLRFDLGPITGQEDPDVPANRVEHIAPAFAFGAAGVGLSLLAATRGLVPSWHAAMLTNLRT